MSLLKGQHSASPQTPLPVENSKVTTVVTDVSGETITLVIASTNANSSGEAAGTVVYARTAKSGVLNSSKTHVGSSLDSSFAFVTGTVLTTQVEWPWAIWENIEDDDRAAKMAAVGATLSNGQFCLQHRSGLLVGKKATTANSDTANYSYRSEAVSVAGGGDASLAEQQTQTTHLAAIETAVEILDNAISGSEMQVDVVGALPAGTNNIGDVDVLSSALPTGASTSANQTTIIGHLDGVEALLGTIDADTSTLAGAVSGTEVQVDIVSSALPTGASTLGEQQTQTTHLAAIETAVETLDNAISGSEMQVDVVAALPAGTNNIGDVDVLSVPRSQSGPSEPGTAIDSYSHVAINLTTGADQVLVSSAASKQIWVYGYAFTCGDAAGQTVSLQDEDNVALTGIMEFAQYGGISAPPSGNFSMPLFKLGTDKDLEIDITGGDVDGWLAYAIVSV